MIDMDDAVMSSNKRNVISVATTIINTMKHIRMFLPDGQSMLRINERRMLLKFSKYNETLLFVYVYQQSFHENTLRFKTLFMLNTIDTIATHTLTHTHTLNILSIMGLFRSILFVALLMFIGSEAEQELINPGSNQNVICGISEACSIICSGNYSCSHNTFHFYNNHASLQCDDDYACAHSIIYSHNASSLNLTFNGLYSFFRSSAFIKQNNEYITTTCSGQKSCLLSSFYYSGQNQFVRHSCNDYWSCYRSLISAIPVKHIALNCLDVFAMHYSCYYTDLFTPVSLESSTTINVETSWPVANYVYSVAGTATLSMICTVNCVTLDEFYLIYGIHLDQVCQLSHTECMNTKYDPSASGWEEQQMIYVDSDNINDLYTGMSADYDRFILYIAPHTASINLTFASSSEIVVVCVASEVRVLPVCDHMWLDLSNTKNATVIADNIKYLNIIGSQQSFTRVNYRAHSYSQHNNYYLNHTQLVQFKCAQTSLSGCILSTDFYLGIDTAMNVECGQKLGCGYANVYSSIDPNDYSFSMSAMRWNIQCIPEFEFSCDRFQIYFPVTWQVCDVPIGADVLTNCALMPTMNPTTNPSDYPTAIPTTVDLIPRTGVCPPGYRVYHHDNDFCQKCNDNEYGTDGTCNVCTDGTHPNINATKCISCEHKRIGLNGFCNVACEFGTNELHTECTDAPQPFYGSDEFNAIMTVIGVLSGCGCIFGGVWTYYKKHKLKEDERSHSMITVQERETLTQMAERVSR
eukprot:102946_1